MVEKRSKEITFTLVGNAHIDPVWLWDWREGYETVKATFRSALDRLQENPDMVFAHSSAAHFEWMANHPEMMAEIRDAVARGQWEPVGGFWVESDVNIPSGEALARQGLYGQRYFEKHLGRRAKVAFLPDSFGHPRTLPQLFRQMGLEYFAFMRPGANEVDLPSNLFLWQSPDGSQVLAARLECYNTNPVFVQSSLERNLDWRPADAMEWIGMYGVGNHGGGPTKKAIASIREAAASPDWPTLRLGDLQSFFERASKRSHPIHADDLQHHTRGCYSAVSRIKELNRKGEETILMAEKWAALGSFFGYTYPNGEFEEAWRRVLFNQFHDIICGASVASAYVDAEHEGGEAISRADRAGYKALQRITQRIDTRRDDRVIEEPIRRVRWSMEDWTVDLGDGTPIVVFNPSAWPRTELVEVELHEWGASHEILMMDDENRPVLHQVGDSDSLTSARPRVSFMAEVPPMGYRLYRAVDEPGAALPEDAPLLTATETLLENQWWRLEVDAATGSLCSLQDKERNLELLAGHGAQLLVIDDPSDSWGHSITSLRRVTSLFGNPKIELVESGPLRATLRLSTSYGACTAEQEISLYRYSPAIDGRLKVHWRERHKALKLAFPFALSETTATFSIPYGHTTWPADGQEEPLQQWFDATGQVRDGQGKTHPYGVALLNDSKYAGDVMGGEMRLTILRSPTYAHHDPRELDPNGHYEYQDQGPQEMRWRLLPHAGPWQEAGVVQAAHDLNAPMPVIREYAHSGDLPKRQSMVTLTPPGQVVVTALKQAEEGDDLILRLYEPAGRQAKATVELPMAKARFEVEAAPHQVKSYRISRTGQVREVNLLEE